MKDQDYQLEEFENEAVNKSNAAKRVAAGAGLVGLGVGAGYAANGLTGEGTPQEEVPEMLTEEDLEGVANTGADQVTEPEVQPVARQYTPAQEPVEAKKPEDDVNITFDKTTRFMNNDELIMTQEEGTLDGRNFKLIDVDGDMLADIIAYDANGNGVYEDDEIAWLDGNEKVYMGHETANTETVRFYGDTFASNDPFGKDPYDIGNEKEFGTNDIHNDFDDEKAGESYYNDYADNNQYYNNNADVDQYSAGIEAPEADIAFNEEDKEDEDFNSYMAENDSDNDSDIFHDNQDDSFDIV